MSSNELPGQYRDMLREALKESNQNERPLKRRKTRSTTPEVKTDSTIVSAKSTKPTRSTNSVPQKTLKPKSRSVTPSVSPKRPARRNPKTDSVPGFVNPSSKSKAGSSSQNPISLNDNDENRKQKEVIDLDAFDDDDFEDDSDEEFDSDEFEDVDVPEDENPDSNETFEYQTNDQEINITLNSKPIKATKKKKSNMCSREEKLFRRNLHMMYIFTMVGHGVIRNVWCGSPTLLKSLAKKIPSKIIDDLKIYNRERLKENISTQSKTRKLLDLIRHLMEYWYKSWHIKKTYPVIYTKQWNEIDCKGIKPQHITKQRFEKMIIMRRGSRDIAAQGFVALLRSIGIPARLVFSLQPPDFTNLSLIEKVVEKQEQDEQKKIDQQQRKQTTQKKVKPQTQFGKLMQSIRANQVVYTNFQNSSNDNDNAISSDIKEYPVFWCEVWDKDAKKYITVDPIVQKQIEIVSLKSRLEPPLNNTRISRNYVIGFDRLGGVRDITRRYTENYNAKIRKKRITREPTGQRWFNGLLKGANRQQRKFNKIDQFEELELDKMSIKEGMPNSIQDFKNHPIYVIEEQLKFNEILKPKISCGTMRRKTSNRKKAAKKEELIPVYRRTNVHIVRSAKGWHMLGRVLKIGERPLKIKEKSKSQIAAATGFGDFDEDEDDDDDVRLYAEFQTELYDPPDIEDGKIPTNAYGNIDIYQPWMIPGGCVHVPNRFAAKAAKLISVEFAQAAVGFDFGGKDKRARPGRSRASVRLEGIVTFEEYEEAVLVVCDYLESEELEEARRRKELIALRAWKLVLSKLKIKKRLDTEHGIVDADNDEDEEEEDDEEEEEGGYNAGGFLVADAVAYPEGEDIDEKDNEKSDYEEDGFMVTDDEPELDLGGGFLQGDPTNLGQESSHEIPEVESKDEPMNESGGFTIEPQEEREQPETDSEDAGGFVIDEESKAKVTDTGSESPKPKSTAKGNGVEMLGETSLLDDPRNYLILDEDSDSDSDTDTETTNSKRITKRYRAGQFEVTVVPGETRPKEGRSSDLMAEIQKERQIQGDDEDDLKRSRSASTESVASSDSSSRDDPQGSDKEEDDEEEEEEEEEGYEFEYSDSE